MSLAHVEAVEGLPTSLEIGFCDIGLQEHLPAKMKFMKLGSKPDQFQTDGDNIRYVATELATDMVINVGDVKFYLHKFPLLSKSSHLQKLVANTSDETDEIHINDIPGGPAATLCGGVSGNVRDLRERKSHIQDRRLSHFQHFRSWKDSIIVLQTTKSLLPWSEELKIVSHCLDSIASKASVDPSKVDWSYTYNRKKLPSENGHDPLLNGVKKQLTVPKDWWVEDLCELQINLYKRAITTIQAKGRISSDVIGESLKAYISRRLPGFSKGTIQGGDPQKYRYLVDTITWLLPTEENSVPCSFLLKLLQASYLLECEEMGRKKLMQKIAEQLGDATLNDLLIRSPNGEIALYNIGIVQNLVEQFVTQECSTQTDCADYSEFQEMYKGFTSDASKSKVAKLVDGYLAEAARDSSLTLSRFLDLADMVSCFPRSTHDGIYRAIDMYLKRLPLRVVVQVLFFEQARAAAAVGGGSMADLPGSVRALLPGGSYGSSRSGTTNTDEDWDGDQTSSELKALRVELASLRLNKGGESNAEKVDVKKMISRLWSNKDENSSSDTSTSE
ncbi:hypothetical protein DH2020_016089 [Rehmannia glutinosa]|uniref:NPH3 domain-containing protein n=1 Tax=Rehmannia glutinosa TaxID=99300 RepID=A0ABR0WUI3_REHGL